MCSVAEEDGNAEFTPTAAEMASKECKKCGTENTSVLLRQIDNYCWECFITMSNHKFRSFLGKNKFIRPGERVLIAFSGGLSSTCMLQMVKNSRESTNPKKLPYYPSILFLDEGIDAPSEVRLRNCLRIFQHANQLQLPIYITTMEQALIGNCSTITEIKTEKDITAIFQTEHFEHFTSEQIKLIFATVRTETAKESLIKIFRVRGLIAVSRFLKIGKLFLGDNLSLTSVRILAEVAQGRGSQLTNSVGLLDARCSDAIILRPMREYSNVELSYVATFYNLTAVADDEFTYWKADVTSTSIDKLTNEFISGLQASFGSTEATIFRTGDKLCPATSTSSNNLPQVSDCQCELCWCSAGVATTEMGVNSTVKNKMVCYGCEKIIQDMESPSLLDTLWEHEPEKFNV